MPPRRRTTNAAQAEPDAGMQTVNVEVAGSEPEPEVVVPALPVVNVKVDGPAEEPTDEKATPSRSSS